VALAPRHAVNRARRRAADRTSPRDHRGRRPWQEQELVELPVARLRWHPRAGRSIACIEATAMLGLVDPTEAAEVRYLLARQCAMLGGLAR